MAELPWVTLPEDKRGQYWADAIGSVGDSIVGAAKAKQERDRHAAEMLLRTREADRLEKANAVEAENTHSLIASRQQQNEQSAAAQHMEATKAITAAIDAGHFDIAEQIAKNYKVPLSQQPGQKKGDTLMSMSQELPPGPPEEGPQATPEETKQAGILRAGQNMPGTAPPPLPQMLAAQQREGDTADAERQRFAGAQFPQPQFAGSQVDAPKPGVWSIGGQQYDPAQTKAADDATREEEAARVGKGFEPLGYGPQAVALQAAGVKPGETASLVAGMMKGDQAAADRHDEKATQREWLTKDHSQYKSDEELKIRLAEIAASGRVRAAQVGAESGPKQDAGTRGDYNAGEQVLKTTDRNVNLKGLVTSNDALRSAMGNITTSNPLTHKDAQIQLAKAIRGTVPTAAEEHMLFDNLGGVADKIPQFWAKLSTGDLSPVQIAMVKDAVGNVQKHTNENLDHAYQAYQQTAADPALKNLAPSLNAGIKARFARVGRDVPDAIETDVQAVPLGSASKAHREQGNPLIDAARNHAKKKGGGRPSLDDLAAQHGLD